MKKSSGLSDATLAGKFYGASIGVTPSGVYTSFHKFSLNGAGSFVITDLFDSNVGLENHSGTYTINSDGTFDTGEHKGMALESGQGFFVVDTNASDSKNEVSISVGLKATK